MEIERKHGPFTFISSGPKSINGTPSHKWRMFYGDTELAERVIPGPNLELSVLYETFEQDRLDLIKRTQAVQDLQRVDLIDFETGDAVAHFYTQDMCGMTVGLIDDRSRYWIRSADKRYSLDVTIGQYAQIVNKHEVLRSAWIAELLPASILTSDPQEWRAPTNWELRHIVGEGSFTGISGAKAAELVGVTPQNFRKYTAQDGASTRQKMSFAMWHLLLQKLEIKRA